MNKEQDILDLVNEALNNVKDIAGGFTHEVIEREIELPPIPANAPRTTTTSRALDLVAKHDADRSVKVSLMELMCIPGSPAALLMLFYAASVNGEQRPVVPMNMVVSTSQGNSHALPRAVAEVLYQVSQEPELGSDGEDLEKVIIRTLTDLNIEHTIHNPGKALRIVRETLEYKPGVYDDSGITLGEMTELGAEVLFYDEVVGRVYEVDDELVFMNDQLVHIDEAGADTQTLLEVIVDSLSQQASQLKYPMYFTTPSVERMRLAGFFRDFPEQGITAEEPRELIQFAALKLEGEMMRLIGTNTLLPKPSEPQPGDVMVAVSRFDYGVAKKLGLVD